MKKKSYMSPDVTVTHFVTTPLICLSLEMFDDETDDAWARQGELTWPSPFSDSQYSSIPKLNGMEEW